MNNQITQELIRGIDCLATQDKTLLPGVLLDKAQAKLIILEKVRAKIGHRHSLGVRSLYQPRQGRVVETNLESVRLSKFFRKRNCAFFEQRFLLLVAFR